MCVLALVVPALSQRARKDGAPFSWLGWELQIPPFGRNDKFLCRTSRTGGSEFDVKVESESVTHILKGELDMRVMVIVKANKDSEAGMLPKEKLLTEMGKFNEELVKAGVLLAGEGLQPTSKGKRVKFSGEKRMVTDGPFTETKELIAGFWLWQVRSMEEAVEWVKRCPSPHEGESEIEIRQVFEAEDFGAEMTPELREQKKRMRVRTTVKKV